jgi:polysaccharide biosynthesis transport protein
MLTKNSNMNNNFKALNNLPSDSGLNSTSRLEVAPPILVQYWQVVLRWKWLILGIILSSLAAGLVATLLMTPKYQATARIEVNREQANVTKVEGLESPSRGGDLEFYPTQISLLKASSLADRVVKSMNLATNDAFFEAHGVKMQNEGGIFTNGGGKPLSIKDRQQREITASKLLLQNINITQIRVSSLIDVSYTSASPKLSADIANAWTQQFIAQSMDRRFASTAEARKFLEGRLADYKTRLETSESELVNYASDKGIIALGSSKSADGKTEVQRTLVSSDLEALNSALAQATADRYASESRASQRSSGGSSTEALNNPAITSLRQKRAEIAAEYAKLMVQFEPGYPAARALSEQLKVLDNSIAREVGRVQDSRSSEYRAALGREAALKAKVESLKSSLDTQQRNNIQYNIFQREADTNRQLYEGLLQRYKEIGVAGVGSNNISVVDVAQIPTSPSSPRSLLNLALALLAGIALAAAAIFALDQIDEGVREPNQISRQLQIPLLGSIPDVENDDTLAMIKDAKSDLSEAYLSIRSNLAFSTDHGVPRSIMVTSTRAAEGKSTTSYALATVLGRTGKSVLLIDADMRSPSVHDFFGKSNATGLSNFLAGDNDWQQLLQQSAFKGLSLIAAGPMPPSAAELLSSDRMLVLMKQLTEKFDHVIVDAPPILGLADAPLLSRAVEGTIFVVEAEGVSVRGAKTSLERLHSVQAHVLGAVLTKLHRRDAGYGYGYGYGYVYGDKQKTA